MATVIDMDNTQEPKSEIVETYLRMREELAALEHKANFWNSTLDAPEMREFLDELQDELDKEKCSWDHIPPKDFALSQAKVQAKQWMISEIRKQGFAEEVRAKRQMVFQYQENNPIFLEGLSLIGPQAADMEPTETAPEPEPEDGAFPGGNRYEYASPNDGLVEIFVAAGLGGDTYGTFYRKPNGSLKRITSSNLPMRDLPENAQADLDAYAEKRGLKLVGAED